MSLMDRYMTALDGLDISSLYKSDFLRTCDMTDDALAGLLAVADALQTLRENNISPRLYDTGLGIYLSAGDSASSSLPFALACSILGLTAQEEVVNGSPNTISWVSTMADVIGLAGGSYEEQSAASQAIRSACTDGSKTDAGSTLINLGSDTDQPVRVCADVLRLIHEFGGAAKLRSKKLTLTWISASHFQPLSVPQSILALFPRFGMNITLAHPVGYNLGTKIEAMAAEQAALYGGSFTKINSLEEALQNADIVFPVCWAPSTDSTQPQKKEDFSAPNWIFHAEPVSKYPLCLYCPPDAPLTRNSVSLCGQEDCSPYIIAAMILLSKVQNPSAMLKRMELQARSRQRK